MASCQAFRNVRGGRSAVGPSPWGRLWPSGRYYYSAIHRTAQVDVAGQAECEGVEAYAESPTLPYTSCINPLCLAHLLICSLLTVLRVVASLAREAASTGCMGSGLNGLGVYVDDDHLRRHLLEQELNLHSSLNHLSTHSFRRESLPKRKNGQTRRSPGQQAQAQRPEFWHSITLLRSSHTRSSHDSPLRH